MRNLIFLITFIAGIAVHAQNYQSLEVTQKIDVLPGFNFAPVLNSQGINCELQFPKKSYKREFKVGAKFKITTDLRHSPKYAVSRDDMERISMNLAAGGVGTGELPSEVQSVEQFLKYLNENLSGGAVYITQEMLLPQNHYLLGLHSETTQSDIELSCIINPGVPATIDSIIDALVTSAELNLGEAMIGPVRDI